jgi:lysophospholipase L1-like esterase
MNDPAPQWHDALSLTVEGRGWADTPGPYDRLPARAEGCVHELDWRFSKHSAGIVVRFVTDSPEISVSWTLKSTEVAMAHMPSTGVSGVDLYVRHQGQWCWLAALRPGTLLAEKNEVRLVAGLPQAAREYSLYLPLYNGVTTVLVGIAKGSSISGAPERRGGTRQVVFYGTSIPQGGCASRPGMAYPSIVGRRLDVPTINLGFSGSGRCEHGIVELLAELDPVLFVVDSVVNMEHEIVEERMANLLDVMRKRRPHARVLLMEEAVHPSVYSREKTLQTAKSATLQKVYDARKADWEGRLFLLRGDTLLSDDGEGTVDGIHPTDLGFQRMADAITPVVKRILAAADRV